MKKFVLITGRHDDAFHRAARGRFSTERAATDYAESARRRGEFDWWVVAEADGSTVAESSEPTIVASNAPEKITTTAPLSTVDIFSADSSATPA